MKEQNFCVATIFENSISYSRLNHESLTGVRYAPARVNLNRHFSSSLYSSTLSTLAKQLQLLSHPSSPYPSLAFLLSNTMVVQTRGARMVEDVNNIFQVLNQRGVVEGFFAPTTKVIRTASDDGSVRIVAYLFTETTTVEGTEDGNAGMDDNDTALNRAKLVVVRFQFGRNAADTSMRRFTAYTPWAPDWHYKLQPH